MKKITLLFIMALGIFASCVPKPEENPDPIPPVSSMFLKKTIEDKIDGSQLISVFTYSGTKILKKENTNSEVTVYTYDDLDLIVKTEKFAGGTLKQTSNYVYDISENLINLTVIDEAASTGTKWVYVHNANGTISYQKFTGDELDQTNLVSTGVISDDQRTEITTDPVTAEETTHTITYDYDIANNPLMNITGYSKIFFADLEAPLNSENNIISATHQMNDEASVLEYVSEYTYTENNFPSKMNVKQEGVLVSIVNFYYY